MYTSVCDFVCIALLLPFVLGFCLPFFCLFVFVLGIIFSTRYHWWISFLVWLLSSFLLSFFFNYLKIFFNNYFLFFILIN